MPPFTPLTTGCLAEIMAGVDIDRPVVQILGFKQISSTEGAQRFRILLSDGKYSHSFAMLATQLNDMMIDNKLKDYTIVRVDKYMTSTVNKTDKPDKKVFILLALDVLHPGDEVGSKLGTPTPIDKGNVATQAANKPSNSGGGASSSSVMGATARNPATMPSTQNGNSSNLAQGLTHPISSLSPYQNKWIIRARVTSKTAIRTWNNAKGEGKLFSMDIMDESGEIRVTAFREQCDKFYDMIEVDKVYFISKCQLKPANKQFTSLKNDYEMTFTGETEVQECVDAVDEMPKIQYNFVPIAQIANMEPNSTIDVCGVCKETGDIFQFTAKTTGRELKKREVTLVDSSNASICLTLWGADAENFDGYTQPVILLKNVRVSEFSGGKSISLVGGSSMKTNPDLPEGHRLRGWFDNGGSEKITASISARTGAGGANLTAEWMTFHETKLENLGAGDKPDYYQCVAIVNMVKTGNPFYKACSQPDCNKKVIDDGNGLYMCEKCKIESQTFKYRILLNMSVADWTSNRWITMFSDLAEKIIGKSAQELGELNEIDKTACIAELSSIYFQTFMFKLRTKAETYGDDARTKNTVISASPINFKEYNKYLINNIQELSGVQKYD